MPVSPTRILDQEDGSSDYRTINNVKRLGIIVLLISPALMGVERATIKGGLSSPDIVVRKYHTSNGKKERYPDVVGEWVFTLGRNFSSNVCCGYDTYLPFSSENSHFMDHPEQCGEESLEPKKEHYRGRTDGFYQQVGGHACYCNGYKDRYVWHAPDLVQEFDPILTCGLLGTRKVLLLGDSTMEQTASTLMNALVHPNSTCPSQIEFMHSDTLVGKQYNGMNRGVTWTTAVNLTRPDIVIVTAGAHIQGGGERNTNSSSDQNYLDMVDQVLSEMEELKKSYPKPITFVWKTQQPGGCTDTIMYEKDPSLAATSFNFSSYKSYQHRQFYPRDLYLLSRLQSIGMPYLDMRMLYSRSDAHIDPYKHDGDCLHMCIPGPLDVVARLFQQLLMDLSN